MSVDLQEMMRPGILRVKASSSGFELARSAAVGFRSLFEILGEQKPLTR